MKNKILPLSLVTLVILLGAFLISATVSVPASFSFGTDDDSDAKLSRSTHLTKMRANQHTGIVDPADVLKARLQAEQNSTKSTAEDFEWRFIGPDNAGGYTKAILFDNNDANAQTIIAGSYSGGLYKSTNTGLTWVKINGIESALNVSGIAQAANGTIYVSTGGWFIGSGIYKSTDGENFTLLESTDPFAPSGIGAFINTNEIVVNQESGVVFASTDLGIWYSSDEGSSWNLARSGETEFLTGLSTDINIGSNGITAASVDGLCYISATGHPNQFELHSSDTFNLPFENVGGLELAIAPSNPDILYATVLETDDDMMNIYRSDDKGVHWRIIAPGGSATLSMTFSPQNNVLEVFPNNEDRILVGGTDMWEGEKIDETGYFQWLQRSAGVTIGSFPEYVHTWHYSYTFRPGSSNEFFIGHDGGISKGNVGGANYEFIELNKTYNTSTAFTIGMSGFPEIVLGGFDMNGVMMLNGHGNPAQAGYGQQIWITPAGVPIPPYGGIGGESFISVIDPYVAIYSTIGGDFRRSEDLGENFSTSFFSSGVTFPDDYIAPALYWENFENEDSRDTVGFSIRDTMPAGTEMWLPSANRSYPFSYITETNLFPGDTLIVKDIVSTKMFIGSDNAVWMTLGILDFGNEPEWFQISNNADAGLDGLVSAMAMSADANFVYVGTEEGSVYRIANISLAYDYDRADVRSPYCIISTAEILTQEQNDQIVTSISVDPQDANKVVVTLGNYGNESYVFKSTNGLSTTPTFTSVQGNLPQMPVYSSLIEMNNPNMCIVGTEMGVYETHNLNEANPTWNTSYEIMGEVPVMDLDQQLIAQPTINLWFFDGVDTTWVSYYGTFNFGNIYAATYGRGLFYSNKYQKPVGIITQDIPEQLSSIKVFPNPVSSMATIEYTLHKRSPITITVVDLNGRMVSREQITQGEGTHQYKLDCGSLPRGMYVVSIQTGNSVQTSKFIVTH